MNREQMRLDQLLACTVIALMMSAALASGDETPEGPSSLPQWAIIAIGDAETRTVADLLLAKLSGTPDLRLAERERIDSVLRELNLSVSGLTDRSQTMQLGQLITADAIVLIDREARSPLMRVRLIESRTGIRLWEDVKEIVNVETVVQQIAADLQAAGKKLKLPAAKRRTVSVMGIVAEQHDPDLESAARSLPAFLERDLQGCADVVVLEREQLKHLAAERELTGVDLELRSSAVLIEGSLRHGNGGKQLVLSMKLSRPDGGLLSSFEVQSDEPDLQSLRATALSKVLLALDAAPSGPRGGEWHQFAGRADWLRDHGLPAEALNSAYAALALAPTRGNYRRVRDLHARQVTLWYRPPQWRPGVTALVLEDATLAHEADLRQLEIGIREGGQLMEMGIAKELDDPFTPHVPIDFSESAEVQAQRAALDEIRLTKYRLLREACTGNSEDLLNVLIPRLHLAAYFAKDEEDYATSVLALQSEIDRAFERLEPTSKWRTLFVSENARAVRQALWLQTWHTMTGQVSGDWTLSTARRYTRQRPWKAEAVRPICAALRDHPAPGIRLAVADREVELGGAEVNAAARRVFSLLRDERPDVPGVTTAISRRCAGVLQKSGELAALVEPIIASAEQSKDLSQIYAWPGGIHGVIMEAEPQARIQWSERIIRLLQADLTAQRSNSERSRAKSLHDRLRQNLPRTAPGLSAELWKNFNVSMFEAETPGIDQCILAAGPTNLPQLRLRGIRSPNEQGERPTLTIPLDEQWRDRMQMEVSPTELFALRNNPAQIVGISQGKTRRVAVLPESGSPFRGRKLLRWLDGKLYLAYTGGFESIDVATGEFTSLASSLAAAPRNQLDGGSPYTIGDIFADVQHQCLWLSVYSRDRGGIWKYTPRENSIERVVQGSCKLCNWDDGGLVFQSFRTEGLWHSLDTKSGALRSWSGYRHAATRNDDQLRPPCIKVGSYVIDSTGVIVTPDGRSSQFPLSDKWELLYPHDEGFIAILCKRDHCTVWQFELRTVPDDTEGQSLRLR